MAKLRYSDVADMAEDETTRIVQLSAFSFSVLLSLLSDGAWDVFRWGEMSEADRDTADYLTSNAIRELLDEYECPVAGGGAVPIGAMIPFLGVNPPDNFVKCDGSVLLRDEYSELWDAIFPNYCNIQTNLIFLPDMRARVPVGYDTPSYPIGFQGGEWMHQLTVTEMPEHNHTVQTGTGSGQAGSGIFIAGTTTERARYVGHEQIISNEGGGLSHNNMPPFHIVPMYIIRVREDET